MTGASPAGPDAALTEPLALTAAEDSAPFAPLTVEPATKPLGRRVIGLLERRRAWVLTAVGALALISLALSYRSRSDRDEPASQIDAEQAAEGAQPADASDDLEREPASGSTGSTTAGPSTSSTASTTSTLVDSPASGPNPALRRGQARSPTLGVTASTSPTTLPVATSSTGPATTETTADSPTTTERATTSEATTTTSRSTTTERTTTTRQTTTTTRRTTTTTAPPTTSYGPNLVANGSFEQPRISGDYQTTSAPSWASTAGGTLEVWRSGFDGISSPSGGQHTELNVHGPTTYSQTIDVTRGATYRWSFQHRGRNGTDSLQVVVDGQVVDTASADQSWRTHSGEVVAGSDSLTLALRSLGGDSYGNFIDDIELRRINT